ncbi:MAG: hypothetical protein M3N46_13465, partial [Actinomycetota bacterium]|nr:hypothetical protein [Actinomycetota bacterium]
TTEAEESRPTTTHAEWGAGNPRLVFNVGEDWDGSPAREFPLVEDITSIGSSEASTLRLTGLDPEQAQIIHEEDDEYVLHLVGSAEPTPALADPGIPERNVLRSGAKVQLGSWSMFFSRDESADHGRPHGGRVGGELSHQPSQPERPDYSAERGTPE